MEKLTNVVPQSVFFKATPKPASPKAPATQAVPQKGATADAFVPSAKASLVAEPTAATGPMGLTPAPTGSGDAWAKATARMAAAWAAIKGAGSALYGALVLTKNKARSALSQLLSKANPGKPSLSAKGTPEEKAPLLGPVLS